MIRSARERRLCWTLTTTYPLVTEVPMHGDPFPMSLWERAVLGSLERIEAILQGRKAPAPLGPPEQERERHSQKTPPAKPSNLLPLRTWAKANNVSYAHAYAMAREGRMPVVRLGRRIYVHLASIETWAARGARLEDLVHFELSDGGWITRLRDDLEQRP